MGKDTPALTQVIAGIVGVLVGIYEIVVQQNIDLFGTSIPYYIWGSIIILAALTSLIPGLKKMWNESRKKKN